MTTASTTQDHDPERGHDRDAGGEADVDAIVAAGPNGTFAVAGVATALVVAMFFAFYVFAYLPRGFVH